MPGNLPQEIDAVISAFDQKTDAFGIDMVSSALQEARQQLGQLADAENRAAFGEILAFALVPGANASPWGTYFGPIATLKRSDGKLIYRPDIAEVDLSTLEGWRDRAKSVVHPVLRARYADLIWDLHAAIVPGARRDGAMAVCALDAYLASALMAGVALDDAFRAAARALSLAITLNNVPKRDAARAVILQLDQRSKAAGSPWSDAYDVLVNQPKSGLTDQERTDLIAGLEVGLARRADIDDAKAFDPHFVQATAARLIAHYRREKRPQDERRVHAVVARATEHFASLGSALLASSVLNDAMEAYKSAGQTEDVERIRRLMAERVREANAGMTAVRREFTVTFDEVDAFKAQIAVDDQWQTLIKIALNFLLRRRDLEAMVDQEEEHAPLLARISQQILGDDYQVASVGSTEEDPFGRVLRQALFALQYQTPWMGWAFEAAFERHDYGVGDLVRWCNRAGLFSDGVLLATGLEAWLGGDPIKAIHVLVPQVERALRNLVDSVGRPSTKAHPRFQGAQIAIAMGDIVFNKPTAEALGKGGEDLLLHIAALYADSRGMNLRNELAHGLLDYRAMHPGTLLWVVHTLLLLGLWRAPQAPPVGDSGSLAQSSNDATAGPSPPAPPELNDA